MKYHLLLPLILLGVLACNPSRSASDSAGSNIQISAKNESELADYVPVMQAGKSQVESFFGKKFPHPFSIVVHSSRAALDSCWQKDWKMPDFHSECWMVASGVAAKLDLLSPNVWAASACEHHWEDSTASARLIAHEMTHVYHGQHNTSPDFSETDRIDWFVEGLAVYASGQCDSMRLTALRRWLQEHPTPESLDQFWSGSQKYGLSGSVVMFLDQKLGRKKLCKLLIYNKKEDLLQAIGMREPEVLAGWRAWL